MKISEIKGLFSDIIIMPILYKLNIIHYIHLQIQMLTFTILFSYEQNIFFKYFTILDVHPRFLQDVNVEK